MRGGLRSETWARSVFFHLARKSKMESRLGANIKGSEEGCPRRDPYNLIPLYT